MFSVQCTLIILLSHYCFGNEEKRLLLNNPTVVDSEVQQLKATVTELKGIVSGLQTQIATIQSTQGGALFVRWGKSSCPDNDTETVYEGFAAGGFYHSHGAGVNFLCLPRDPTRGNDHKGTIYARLYGAEYDAESTTLGKNLNNGDDMPCAVCRSHSGVTAMMLPGRNECYPGWRKQHSGNLATANEGDFSSKDFICVDENAESLVAGGHDDNGALIYPVHAVCGALACPPYVQNQILTCVVCTK